MIDPQDQSSCNQIFLIKYEKLGIESSKNRTSTCLTQNHISNHPPRRRMIGVGENMQTQNKLTRDSGQTGFLPPTADYSLPKNSDE